MRCRMGQREEHAGVHAFVRVWAQEGIVKHRQNQRPRWARGRPAGLAIATVNRNQLPADSRRRLEPLSERRWTRGGIPRPASLGEAGRPHLAASEALPWRVRQAQLTYLCATNAQPSTDHIVL